MPPVHGLEGRVRACRSTSDALSVDTRFDLPFGPSRPCREALPRPPPRQRRPPLPDQSAFPRQVPSRSSIVRPPLAQSTADFTRSSKTRHRVPGLAALGRAFPPRTGFGRRFHFSHLAMTLHEDEPRLVPEASSASAERAVSCRRLQSKQPTSTTTNLPSPGREDRRGTLGSRQAGRRPPDGVGAPSPHRPPIPGAASLAHALEPCSPRTHAHSTAAGVSRTRGSSDERRDHRLPSSVRCAGIRTAERP
jgi:hypothetical protein